MIDNFEKSLGIVRKWEGGWSDHGKDPGGLTRWGISIRFLRGINKDFNGDGIVNGEDLAAMSEHDAENLYRTHFWEKAKCDQIPRGIDTAVFDCAVNQGPGRAARFLQQAAGVKVDGIIGAKTISALHHSDRENVLLEFQTRRALHYTGLAIFATFGRGWIRRLLDVHAKARELL